MSTAAEVESVISEPGDFVTEDAGDGVVNVRYPGPERWARNRLFGCISELERAGFTVHRMCFGGQHGLPAGVQAGRPNMGDFYEHPRDPHLRVSRNRPE